MFINNYKQAAIAAAIANKLAKREEVTFTAKDFYKEYTTNVLNRWLGWNKALQNKIARAIVEKFSELA